MHGNNSNQLYNSQLLEPMVKGCVCTTAMVYTVTSTIFHRVLAFPDYITPYCPATPMTCVGDSGAGSGDEQVAETSERLDGIEPERLNGNTRSLGLSSNPSDDEHSPGKISPPRYSRS